VVQSSIDPSAAMSRSALIASNSTIETPMRAAVDMLATGRPRGMRDTIAR
jgi:hypothetical protein